MNRERQAVAQALLAREIFGIDPGRSNGAIYRYHPVDLDEVIKMPREFMDIVDYFKYQKEICKLPLAFVEKVVLRHDDKNGKQFRIQALLENYSEIISALKVSGMPYIEVHPITWQTFLRLKIKGEDSTIRKRRYKDVASSYNALIKPTLWNCDALLIAYFGVRKVELDPLWVLQNMKKNEQKKPLF